MDECIVLNKHVSMVLSFLLLPPSRDGPAHSMRERILLPRWISKSASVSGRFLWQPLWIG